MQTLQIAKRTVKPLWRIFLNAANDNIAADLLRGAEAIAEFIGFPRRAVYHAVAKNHLPHFRIGETVCARKSTLTAWIAEQERAAA